MRITNASVQHKPMPMLSTVLNLHSSLILARSTKSMQVVPPLRVPRVWQRLVLWDLF